MTSSGGLFVSLHDPDRKCILLIRGDCVPSVMMVMRGIVSHMHIFIMNTTKLILADFTHDHSRSRAYRWGEDGIAGVSDTHGNLNIAFAFWNEKDDILKERLFGLGNSQGNHGESIKEAHFHLDNTPTVRVHQYASLVENTDIDVSSIPI